MDYYTIVTNKKRFRLPESLVQTKNKIYGEKENEKRNKKETRRDLQTS